MKPYDEPEYVALNRRRQALLSIQRPLTDEERERDEELKVAMESILSVFALSNPTEEELTAERSIDVVSGYPADFEED